jgi:hypothetical protein
MNESLALRLLRKIMDWDEDTATREYRWLRLMSRLKFDGYRDYLAGVRFSESLAGWLSQFDPAHCKAAYGFVKNRRIYFRLRRSRGWSSNFTRASSSRTCGK